MRVRLLVGLAGNDYALGPRDEWDFPDAEAQRLIDAGFAARIDAVEQAQPAVKRGSVARKTKPKAGDVVSGRDNAGG